MWQDQLIWCPNLLLIRRKIHPMPLRRGIGQDHIPDGNQIDVKRPHAPTGLPHPSKLRFHLM